MFSQLLSSPFAIAEPSAIQWLQQFVARVSFIPKAKTSANQSPLEISPFSRDVYLEETTRMGAWSMFVLINRSISSSSCCRLECYRTSNGSGSDGNCSSQLLSLCTSTGRSTPIYSTIDHEMAILFLKTRLTVVRSELFFRKLFFCVVCALLNHKRQSHTA